ncbi:MAG: VOC family protein [Planctomycetes bacterium]|nr:VOC family protein [Planctomycetota bacterium]
MTQPPLFHLAFGVQDLERTRRFYLDVLGCLEGRSAERWVDFDLCGHQLSAHVVPAAGPAPTNPVDGDQVPIPHFGLILEWGAWEALAERVRAHGAGFVIEPRVRFRGQAGEQGTFFLRDPSGNHLEFKTFRTAAEVFARELGGAGGSPTA